MFTHRYHLPYYQQVAVFFWPILFFELWRVDRWQDQTGRRAFVTPDKYGRAWVPYFEGMSQKPHLNDLSVSAYKPDDIVSLCPGWLDAALAPCPNLKVWLKLAAYHLHASTSVCDQSDWAPHLDIAIDPLAPG